MVAGGGFLIVNLGLGFCLWPNLINIIAGLTYVLNDVVNINVCVLKVM